MIALRFFIFFIFKMITFFTDGATEGMNGKLGTVKHCGLGFWCADDEYQYSERVEAISNNKAEFLAVIEAMKYAISKGYKEVEFKLDSMIVVNRANRDYIKPGQPGINSLQQHKKQQAERKLVMDGFQRQVLELKKQFTICIFTWIPREQNELADHLSKYSLHKRIN